jgi:hypothetical protein
LDTGLVLNNLCDWSIEKDIKTLEKTHFLINIRQMFNVGKVSIMAKPYNPIEKKYFTDFVQTRDFKNEVQIDRGINPRGEIARFVIGSHHYNNLASANFHIQTIHQWES